MDTFDIKEEKPNVDSPKPVIAVSTAAPMEDEKPPDQADMDGASALAALASAASMAQDTVVKQEVGNNTSTNNTITSNTSSNISNNGIKNEVEEFEEKKKDLSWFDVGLIKVTNFN